MSTGDVTIRLRDKFGEGIEGERVFRKETTVCVKPDQVWDVLKFCRDDLGFDCLLDIASVDYFGEDPRFEMVYELYAMERGEHLRIKAKLLGESEATVRSVSDLWPTADWHEREVYDMMGIRFDGHPDLRRILMWEGYPYHPLRKDFPLEGKPSEVKDVAFTETAPLAGGPFVTAPTDGITEVREPRARRAGDEPPREKFLSDS